MTAKPRYYAKKLYAMLLFSVSLLLIGMSYLIFTPKTDQAAAASQTERSIVLTSGSSYAFDYFPLHAINVRYGAVGGGGGGGGSYAENTALITEITFAAAGGGGGGGGYALSTLGNNISGTFTYSVGGGGAGGTGATSDSGSTNPNACPGGSHSNGCGGNNSTMTFNGTTVTGGGGYGGLNNAHRGNAVTGDRNECHSAGPGGGGSASGGGTNTSGSAGTQGATSSGSGCTVYSGAGGASGYGTAGGAAQSITSAESGNGSSKNGNPGAQCGSGGGGSAARRNRRDGSQTGTGGNGGIGCAIILYTEFWAQPAISISPASGLTDGGTAVSLTVTNDANYIVIDSVTIDGAAVAFTYTSGVISFTTPAHVAGAVAVSVAYHDTYGFTGYTPMTATYTYVEPYINMSMTGNNIYISYNQAAQLGNGTIKGDVNEITVNTNNTYGYQMTMTTSGSSLVCASDAGKTIPTIAGDGSLTAAHFGWRAETSSQAFNSIAGDSGWRAISSSQTLRSTSAPRPSPTGETTYLYFGVKGDLSIQACSDYVLQLMITAVTNVI